MGAGVGGAGAATMPRPGGAMGGMTGAEDGADKKKVDPKMLMVGGGVVALALVALLASGALGGGAPEVIPTGTDPLTNSSPGRTNGGAVVPVPALPPVSPGGGGGNTDPPPIGPPLPAGVSKLSTPNPKFETAAFGIAPEQPVSEQDAVNMANKARQEMESTGTWKKMQIFVFADKKSGQAFSQYMNNRRGQRLDPADFQALAQQNAWANATVCLESSGKQAKGSVRFPYKHPTGWWGR